MKKNKFGINIQKSVDEYHPGQHSPQRQVIGVSCHIGSQLTEVGPFVDAVQRIKELVQKLRAEGIHIRYLDLGGGLGITYHQEEPAASPGVCPVFDERAQRDRLHPDPGTRPGDRRERGHPGDQGFVHQRGGGEEFYRRGCGHE